VTQITQRAAHNLQISPGLERHEDIATTVKYAHVVDSDLRRAMEAESKARQKSHQKSRQPHRQNQLEA